MRLAALFLCLPLLAQNPAPARVEGRVVDDKDKPIARAQVSVGNVQVFSSEDGSFTIEVPPSLRLPFYAEKSGYLRVIYDQGQRFSLESGEVLTGVLLRMPQQAVITGRVTNEFGDPVPGARIEVVSSRYLLGQPEDAYYRGVQADDQGNYRVYGLPAGRYYAVASEKANFQSDRAGVESALETYYGQTPFRKQATPIVLAPGQEAHADITLLRQPLFTIRGKLIDPKGNPIPGTSVRATALEEGLERTAITKQNGEFEIPRLPAGPYILRAPRPSNRGGPKPTRLGILRVIAGGSNGPVTFQVSAGEAVTGRVRLEEGELPMPASVPQDSFGYTSQGMLTDVPAASRPFAALVGSDHSADALAQDPQPAALSKDGNFEVRGAEGYPYRLAIGVPEGLYVKQVKQGDADVTHAPIRPGGEPLDVLLSAKGAVVTGTLPSIGMSVALWPLAPDTGHPLDGIRIALSGKLGAARLVSLPPGRYRIAAFETDSGALWNYDFLNKFTAEAASVALAEGDKKNIEIPVVPVARFNEELAKLP